MPIDPNTVFLPTADDMEGRYVGLLVASFNPETSDDGLIAVGPGLTPDRAKAAFAAYIQDIHGSGGWNAGEEFRAQLNGGEVALAITPTAFTRDADGTWTAHPHSPGADLAAWIVQPGHPALTA